MFQRFKDDPQALVSPPDHLELTLQTMHILFHLLNALYTVWVYRQYMCVYTCTCACRRAWPWYTNGVFGTAKCVLFIELPSFQGVLLEGVHCRAISSSSLLLQVHPNHKHPASISLRHYEFAGRVVGKCLYESALGNRLLVSARFSRSFLAQMIGLRINYKVVIYDVIMM